MKVYDLVRRWIGYRFRALVGGIFVPESPRRVTTQQRHRQLDRIITGLERRSTRR